MYDLSEIQFAQGGQIEILLGINAFSRFLHVIDQLSQTLFLVASPFKLFYPSKHLTIVGSLPNSNNATFIVNEEEYLLAKGSHLNRHVIILVLRTRQGLCFIPFDQTISNEYNRVFTP